MKKFLRAFKTQAEYLAFTASTEFILDNVSSCREGDLVYYTSEECRGQGIHRTISGETYCDGYDKRVYIYKQVSYDDGITWETTATTSSLVEKDSEDCGYVPPIVQQSISAAVVTCDSKVYNGNVQTAQNIVVRLNGDTLVANTDYIITENNGGTNVGNYTIAVSGTGNYYDTASGSFTINKVTPTVTAPTAKNLKYNGSAQALVNAGSTNFGTLKYSIDSINYAITIPSRTNASSYTVYYKVDGNNNVNDVAAQTVACSIAKGDSSLSFGTSDITLGIGETNSNVVTVNAGDGIVTYVSNDTSVVTVDNSGNITGVSAGNTTVTANISSTNNYNSASTSYNVHCNGGDNKVWVRLSAYESSLLMKDVPVYKIGVLDGAGQGSYSLRFGFSHVPSPNYDPNNSNYMARIWFAGDGTNRCAFIEGTYSTKTYDSGWQYFSNANFVKQSITLINGTTVNNIYVYDTDNPSQYDRGSGPTYFFFRQVNSPLSDVYAYVKQSDLQ